MIIIKDHSRQKAVCRGPGKIIAKQALRLHGKPAARDKGFLFLKSIDRI
jgi:hypothetical protein